MKKFIFYLLLLSGCQSAKNYKFATKYQSGDTTIIELYGSRYPNVHSIEPRIMIKDTFILKLKHFNQGVISANEIFIKPGFYTYTGYLKVKNDTLLVNLFAINTDDNTIDTVSYNGVYFFK